ncbi:MAG: hypothetical protein MUC36_17985 [Planctomycetes bacterium]|jgi:hypothetical protein|nr:hypothetical protein [Planctomycetota bacterium]
MDREILQAAGRLLPVEVQQYLRSRGWQQESVTPDRSAVYRHGDHEVLVLLRTDLADYSRRGLELLEVIADHEVRSVRQVLDDLSQPPGDVLSLRVESERVISGTVPLGDRLAMGEATRQMLLAAAHSEISRQSYFPRLARRDAMELLASVREAQSQRGSYVSRIIVPVGPALPDAETPFGRCVVRRLMRALETVRDVRALGQLDPLVGKAEDGVSANLLAALAAFEPTVGRGQLEISVSWSRRCTAPVDINSRIAFPEASLDGLRAVAELMRNRAETPGFDLVGYVTRLAAEDASAGGKIVIVPTDDAPGLERVHVQLAANDYQVAVTAHRDGRTVRVIGTLAKAGRTWALQDPYGFTMLPATE